MNKLIISKCNEKNMPLRGIRSFSRRQGRLTKRQKIAIENYWIDMGVNFQQETLNLSLLFGRDAPLVLEIGFGMGSSLVNMAENNPHQNFLGIEVYTPGVGACLSMAKKAGIQNLRIISHDAVEVFQKMIPNNTLTIVQLFFPDPWYKKRHNKRRIIQVTFCELVMHKLIIGGLFHIATDWEDYAKHVLKVINEIDGYVNLSESQDYILRPETRPLTKFEQRGQKLGYGVWDLMFKRIKF